MNPQSQTSETLLAREQAARLEAEQAHARAVNVLESITDGFLTLDREWRFTYINQPAEQILHLSRADALGRNVWEMFPQAVGSRDYREYHRAVAENRTAHFEQFYPTLDLWADVRAYPTPEGLAIYFRDVTGRKKAEEALRQSEERHRLITELTSDYVYTCTVAADGTITIDSVTEGFERITGYTLAEVQQRGGWTSLLNPDDLAASGDTIRRLLAGERNVQEIRLCTRTGETRWIRFSSQPVWDPAEGRVVRFLGAVHDITPRKRAEEKLQEYARRLQALSRRLLEVQEQERRYLARELHDEIGQDLTGLKLGLELSAHLCGGELTASLGESTRQLQELTAKVRDLSLRLRPTMLDDLGLVPALLWHFERYRSQTRLRVDFDWQGLERRLPAEVETAAYRIVQEALTNVARHGGTNEAVVRLGLEGERLCLRVEDRGAGFDPAAVPVGGSGGLSGMHERAVLLGGHFLVESRPGAGTRLTAVLPLSEAQRERP